MDAVQTSRDDDVLIVEIHNPPINAASTPVRAGLIEAMSTLAADDTLRGAVLIGGGSGFIAGSDLREFGRPLEEPQFPAVVAAIEAGAKPVVAALHGAALGGGLEIALACDARIARAGTVLGLPEVTLGLIPGGGGTQRLPRRTGLVRAMGLLCRGERLDAEQALALRLVDTVTPDDPRAAAIARVRELAGSAAPKRRLRDETVPTEDPAAIERAAAEALRAARHRPAALAAVEALRDAARLPIEAGQAREREVFLRLRASPEARALRHQFFAEREAVRLPEGLRGQARPIRTVAVIGAGTMGAGIAIAALNAGLAVLLLEQDEPALERGRQRVTDHYAERVATGKLDASTAAGRLAGLRPATDWARLAEADLVIEAVIEDLAVKQAVFARIDALARPGALLASNTSYLDLDTIAAATRRPQAVLGLHFFSPAPVMKLLEVVRGRASDADTLATGLAFGRRLGKLPVLCGNAFGFIGNRIYDAYRRQCEFMLEDGAWPEDVDRALEAWGFAMGPFAVADLSGLDIAWRMRRARAATRDPGERHVDVLDRLCEAGRYGRKSGAGYYAYPDGQKQAASDATVHGLVEAASARRGRPRRTLAPAEIQRRALLVMVNEAALLLAEGVAQRASDIDVVLVQGYGFPRWEGGPVFWARQQARAELEAELGALLAESGSGFRLADLGPLLDEAPAPR